MNAVELRSLLEIFLPPNSFHILSEGKLKLKAGSSSRYNRKRFVCILLQQHWLACCYASSQHWEVFDSLGYDENRLKTVKQMLSAKKLRFNSQCLQSTSSVQCGVFCAFFLYLRAVCSYKYSRILQLFSRRQDENEEFVKKFLRKCRRKQRY
jgi:hypothetical protein